MCPILSTTQLLMENKDASVWCYFEYNINEHVCVGFCVTWQNILQYLVLLTVGVGVSPTLLLPLETLFLLLIWP